MVKHNIWVSFVVYKEGDLVNRETIYTYLCRPSPQLYISPDTKSGTGLSVKTQLNQIQKITEYLYQTWFSGLVSNFPPFLLLPSYLILNILPVWAAQSTRQTAAGTIFKLNFSRISASQVCDTWHVTGAWQVMVTCTSWQTRPARTVTSATRRWSAWRRPSPSLTETGTERSALRSSGRSVTEISIMFIRIQTSWPMSESVSNVQPYLGH